MAGKIGGHVLVIQDAWVTPPGATEPSLKGTTLGLGAAEWLAITGPNGCGKSSLALAAAGLWAASRGRIEMDGVPLAPTAEGRARAGIATVLQEPSSQLFERTVGDEIAFAARNLGVGEPERSARVREWSDRFGLAGMLERDPHALSAGGQQRVLLAGALASAPRLLVVDEGAAHLDAPSRALVLGIIRAEVSKGLSVLWVTQDPGECAAADRALALGTDGRLLPHAGPVPAEDGAIGAVEDGRVVSSGPHGARLDVRIETPDEALGRRVHTTRRLEFALVAGAPIALVGPNAAGKSVALEAIAGVQACPQVIVTPWPSGGPPPVLAAQYPELQVFGETVAEELSFGVVRRGGKLGQALDIASQLLVEFELECDMLNRSTWSLSTGERRLVQVIAALVTPASAVLIDEPTCGLDPTRSRALGRILGRIAESTPMGVATQDGFLVSQIRAETVRLGGST